MFTGTAYFEYHITKNSTFI